MPNQRLAEEIIRIYKKHGEIVYGEAMHVNSHSVQAGLIAKEQGLDNELILSAFLHDIGHLYPLEVMASGVERMGDFGIEQHDKWGEVYLRKKGFSERIIAPVKNHVKAKKYLCYAEAGYYEQLSVASKETLGYQGGPMSEQEAKEFEAESFFEESICIRRIDEAAKKVGFMVNETHWRYFSALIGALIDP